MPIFSHGVHHSLQFSRRGDTSVPDNKLIIKLTDDQQKQIKDATGQTLTELKLNFAKSGGLKDQDLEQISGGWWRDGW